MDWDKDFPEWYALVEKELKAGTMKCYYDRSSDIYVLRDATLSVPSYYKEAAPDPVEWRIAARRAFRRWNTIADKLEASIGRAEMGEFLKNHLYMLKLESERGRVLN